MEEGLRPSPAITDVQNHEEYDSHLQPSTSFNLHRNTSLETMMTLSPTTAYYIRRLIRQNLDQLQSVVTKGAGIRADPLSDLDAVIQDLYQEPHKANSALFELERLVNFHKGLKTRTGTHHKELGDVEKRLFWLLGFKLKQADHRGTVLLVDDMPENLRLLTTTLTEQGYEVSCAISGPMALNAIQRISPDVILLDIRMPGMDGYEVCEHLKSTSVTQDIPILFVSASDDVSDKVKAFDLGGADYVTKPFQIEEVLARIHYQLKIRELQRRLEGQNVHLEQQIRDRTQPFSPTSHQAELQGNQEPQGNQQAIDSQSLLANIPAVIHRFCCDETWTTLYMSDAIEAIAGFPPETFTHQGRSWLELIHPVDRPTVNEHLQHLLEHPSPYGLEFRIVHANGDIRWVYQHGKVVIADDGTLSHIDSALMDISHRKDNLPSLSRAM